MGNVLRGSNGVGNAARHDFGHRRQARRRRCRRAEAGEDRVRPQGSGGGALLVRGRTGPEHPCRDQERALRRKVALGARSRCLRMPPDAGVGWPRPTTESTGSISSGRSSTRRERARGIIRRVFPARIGRAGSVPARRCGSGDSEDRAGARTLPRRALPGSQLRPANWTC